MSLFHNHKSQRTNKSISWDLWDQWDQWSFCQSCARRGSSRRRRWWKKASCKSCDAGAALNEVLLTDTLIIWLFLMWDTYQSWRIWENIYFCKYVHMHIYIYIDITRMKFVIFCNYGVSIVGDVMNILCPDIYIHIHIWYIYIVSHSSPIKKNNNNSQWCSSSDSRPGSRGADDNNG